MKRLLSDIEIAELVDNMDGEGGIDRFTVNRRDVHALVVDAIERELAAHDAQGHVVFNGVCHDFGDSKEAIHFEIDGVGYHLLPGGHVDTPAGRVAYIVFDDELEVDEGTTEEAEITVEDRIWNDVYDGKRLGNEARDIEEAIRQLREGLLPEAGYSHRPIRHLMDEHPLAIKLRARLADIRTELTQKI